MEGIDACRAELGASPDVPTLACSSAGGGLRLAVVGYERVVTAEAGHRVGLSAGARVSYVASGLLDVDGVRRLLDNEPDVVLLVGGTDGGNAEVLLHNAAALAASELRVPVVAAGNVDARDEVDGGAARRREDGLPDRQRAAGHRAARSAAGARDDPRGVHPARDRRQGALGERRLPGPGRGLRRPTPCWRVSRCSPTVRGGVAGVGDVLVVDVGGATTDVYSVVTPQGEDAVLRREVVEVMWRARTVEGDLGMRWNAPGVVDAAVAERLVTPEEQTGLRAAAARRAAAPSYLADSDDGAGDRHAAGRACGDRRPAPARSRWQGPARGGPRRRVRRRAAAQRRRDADRILAPALGDFAGGWPVPERARTVVDASYVLAAAGLLAGEHPRGGGAAAAVQPGALSGWRPQLRSTESGPQLGLGLRVGLGLVPGLPGGDGGQQPDGEDPGGDAERGAEGVLVGEPSGDERADDRAEVRGHLERRDHGAAAPRHDVADGGARRHGQERGRRSRTAPWPARRHRAIRTTRSGPCSASRRRRR